MKFMKLGSKPDAFQSDGNFIRYVASELAADVIVVVGEVKFYLHKFPLLSKSNRLQTLISNESDQGCDTVQLDDFPGGPKAFEICAKFCYGMTVTLNPYIVAGARCAAEYLEMTEDVERGNLVFKIEVFLNSSILRSWKDSIIVLQTTKSLLPWSEDLRLVARCVDSIASKISVDPTSVSWSYTCNRKLLKSSSVSASEIKMGSVPKDWWVEDICELEMDLYERVITAVRSKGKTKEGVIGEALRAYTARWIPDSAHSSAEFSESHKNLIETIVSLLSPSGVGCSCNFLLRLLKFAILVDAADATYEVLLESISTKIDEASVDELLIPARVPQAAIYDVELVMNLVRRFVGTENENGRRGGSWINLGKLMDGYLKEVARDPGLSLAGFVELIRCVPDSARPIHDGLYAAIDIYLQEHPGMTKAEKKKLCGQMDVRKLTTDASLHAAQNERLPLRTVVQVLYFEQIRAAAGVQLQQQTLLTNSSSCCSDDSGGGGRGVPHHHQQQQIVVWEKEPLPDTRKLETDWTSVSDKYPPVAAAAHLAKNGSCKNRGSAGAGAQLLPSRSRRILDKIWSVRKGAGSGENRSSETSGSSQSPNSLLQGGETNKSSGSSSRNRRHSIS